MYNLKTTTKIFNIENKTWTTKPSKYETVDQEFFNNCTSKEAIQEFRALGGLEKIQKGKDWLVLESHSPDRTQVVIRVFSKW